MVSGDDSKVEEEEGLSGVADSLIQSPPPIPMIVRSPQNDTVDREPKLTEVELPKMEGGNGKTEQSPTKHDDVIRKDPFATATATAQHDSSLGGIDESQSHGVQRTSVRFSLPPCEDSEQRVSMSFEGSKRQVFAEDGNVNISGKGDRRKSSLDSRRNIPDSFLLRTRNDIIEDGMKDSTKRNSLIRVTAQGCFYRFFLNPSYPLRRQMLLTFGSVSSLTIVIVMLVSIIASITTGNAIKEKSNVNMGNWVEEITISTSQFVSEALSPKIMPNDLVDLMVEIVQDRFAGYPTTEDDSSTPFFDIQSKSNIYPLKNNPLPLDWNYSHTPNERGNVNDDNYMSHVQSRWPWYSEKRRLSTAVAMYTMQGACDPRADPEDEVTYYPNCTDANNNITTGGVVAPSPTNKQIYDKGADLSPFLKALYEYHYIKQLGYYFSNSGAGSSVFFPQHELDSSHSYVSAGCDWMRAPNPIDPSLGPIGTEEEIARCHPKGEEVPTREYNPLERGWCQEQALNPNRVHSIGPYLSAWDIDNKWMMTVGRAVYDIKTKAFVCCVAVEFLIDNMNQILEDVKVDELGILTLVRNDEHGTVASSPKFDLDSEGGTTTVDNPALETGVDQEMFEKIKSLVNFSQPWDAKTANEAYAKTFSDNDDDHIVSAYPVPTIPEEHDPSYRPEFFAIFSLPKGDGLTPIVDEMNQEVDDTVEEIVIFTVTVGLVGLAVVIVLIFATSSWFVEPLKWMNKVGDQIVGKFGEELDTGIDYDRKKSLPCSPKTELGDLVEEFTTMVSRFSGDGTAKRTQMNEREKINLFDFTDDFHDLYQSRDESDFSFKFPKGSAAPGVMGRSDNQSHLGRNVTLPSHEAMKSLTLGTDDKVGKAHKSPIFRWMVALIVTPVLVTTVVLSAVVLWQISSELPSLISPVKEEYMALRHSYRFTKTEILAIRATEAAERAARDLHLLTRFASWLYFGGMELSGTFTAILQGAEECKAAPSDQECEWSKDLPCDCDWNDFYVRGNGMTCRTYQSGSRHLQKVHFGAQSQDTGPDGSRYNISSIAMYPNMTSWWNYISDLPRSSESEESARSNYGTTYDRAKIISALSAVIMPLYNYDKSNDKPLGIYIGFEADGAFTGYSGCDHLSQSLPFWSSTEENGAAQLRPELCPIGNHGFDARCRSWYDDGRKKANNGKNLHLTGPYLFLGDSVVGQSITSPLIDPANKKYIGQTLVDFLPNSTFKALESDYVKLADGGYPIMITPENDTVVGPGYSLEKGRVSIEDLLSPDDAFRTILKNMKLGKGGEDFFHNETSQEEINITYAPVVVRSYLPLNSSDIASGVENKITLVYSLALAETRNGILQSFQSINDFSSTTVNICIGVLSAIVVTFTMLIVYIALRVTKSMTKPILQLLDVMKHINCMRISNDDVTQLSNYRGSCREVDSVYKTMEMLYKVVQFANVAFFVGDLDVAYRVLKDALRLFTRLNNKKAIAVASNNLGNTMLTIYRTMKSSQSETMCGLSKVDAIAKGSAYFALSIKLGEEAYDEFYNKQGWSEECLVFMQFLANRYFNRAMFFLNSSCDNESRTEAESLGFRDLQIAMDMDVEIVDQCLEMGFKIDRVERYELMLSRSRGLLALVELGYNPDDLFIEDQIRDLYQYLQNATKNPLHDLFKEITVAGRMQKFDMILMKYFSKAKNDNTNAARVAIRMLVEDEYLFPDAEQEAIEVLLAYVNAKEDISCPKDKDGDIMKELGSALDTLKQDSVKRSSSNYSSGNRGVMRSLNITIATDIDNYNLSIQSLEQSEEWTDREMEERRKSERRSSAIKESMIGDITMEIF